MSTSRTFTSTTQIPWGEVLRPTGAMPMTCTECFASCEAKAKRTDTHLVVVSGCTANWISATSSQSLTSVLCDSHYTEKLK